MIIYKEKYELMSALYIRMNRLAVLIEKKRQALENVPEGLLRVVVTNGKVRYYFRKNTKDLNGEYLPATEKALIVALAQKEYDIRALKMMEAEYNEINKVLKKCASWNLENLYKRLPDKKKLIIEPCEVDIRKAVDDWKNQPYIKKPNDQDDRFVTKSGVIVRSKSETLIGDNLDSENVPYRYEFPVVINGKVWNPDFNCLNVRTFVEYYWEHFGQMDNPQYCQSTLQKIKIYTSNGYLAGVNMIYTFESLSVPLTSKHIYETIEMYLR